MPSTVLSELHYLPCIDAFHHFKKADLVLVEACENYQKGSYRNRCHLLGANGVQRLSIPLAKGKNNQQPIQQVALTYHEPWHRQHWQSIQSAYGNSPFFAYYADALAPHFLTKQYAHLWDFNLALLTTVFGFLHWADKTIQPTTAYAQDLPPSTVDIRNTLPPATFSEGSTGTIFPAYPQVFGEKHGFIPNLSILDLIFCQGPQSNLYLSSVSES